MKKTATATLLILIALPISGAFSQNDPFEKFEREKMRCFFINEHGSLETVFHIEDKILFIDGKKATNRNNEKVYSEIKKKEGGNVFLYVEKDPTLGISMEYYVNFDEVKAEANAIGFSALGRCRMQ